MLTKDRNGIAGTDAQILLQEILDNQKEALDLSGQLVLLNQKMDVLIEKVGEQAAKPKSNLELLLGNHQAMFSIVFIILVALFLGATFFLLIYLITTWHITNKNIYNVSKPTLMRFYLFTVRKHLKKITQILRIGERTSQVSSMDSGERETTK